MLHVPIGRCHARNAVLRLDIRLVHRNFGECACGLVPFQSGSANSGEIDVSAKVTGQVTEVSGLLDDWAATDKYILELEGSHKNI